MNIPAIIIPTGIELNTSPISEISQEVSKVIDYIPEKQGESYLLINQNEQLLAEIKIPILIK